MPDLSDKFCQIPELEKPARELPEPFFKEVQSFIDQYRQRFQENMEKEIPTHPYKVMMAVKKEEGLYMGDKYDFSEEELGLERALQELYSHHKEKWVELKEAGGYA